MSTFSVIYVDMKCVTPRVGHTDIHTDGQNDQMLQFQELLYATKKHEDLNCYSSTENIDKLKSWGDFLLREALLPVLNCLNFHILFVFRAKIIGTQKHSAAD